MANEHPLEEVIRDLSGEMQSLREDAKKSKAVPLGSEKISARELRSRLKSMSAEGRDKLARQLIADMGIDKFMDMVRNNGSRR